MTSLINNIINLNNKSVEKVEERDDKVKPIGRVLSIPVEISKNSNSSDIYASALCQTKLRELPLNYPKTPLQIFLQSVHKFPNRPFLGKTSFDTPVKYKWQTYREIYNRVIKFGSQLPTLAKQYNLPKRNNQLVILGRPEPNWILVDLACQAYSWKTLTLFENFSFSVLQNLSNTINECSVIVSDLKRVASILTVSDSLSNLKLIICMTQIDKFNKLHFAHLVEWAKQKDINLVSLQELEGRGKLANNPNFKAFNPKEVSTVGFTQGTTDLPKGVQFTGYQLAFSTYSTSLHLKNYYTESSIEYSHLSYANLNARIGLYHLMSIGGSVGYYSHREDGLGRMQMDCKQLTPTHLRTTTKTLEQIYTQITNIIQSDKVIHQQYKKLLEYTLNYRLNSQDNGSNQELKTYLVSKLFSALTLKFQFWFGYRLKYIFCIGASVSPKVQQLLELLMNVTIIQGYTTTETCGIVLCTQFKDSKDCYGTTGGVIPGYEVKLVDVPDLGYFVNGEDGASRGELWVRGTSVGTQYFNTKNSTLNEGSFTNGWYKTGDIAEINPYRGTFNIIDRKSNFFQLKDGLYVTPEKIEKEYQKSHLINQIYIPQSTTLTGIIVPNYVEFIPWLQYTMGGDTHYNGDNIVDYLKDPEVLSKFLDKINSSMQSMKILKSYELLNKIILIRDKFETLDGTVSPTFKLKRSGLFKHFSKLLETEKEHKDPEPKL